MTDLDGPGTTQDAALTLFAVVPLDVAVVMDAACLGQRIPVVVDDQWGALVLPNPRTQDAGPLQAPDGFGRVEVKWGGWNSGKSPAAQVQVEALAFQIPLVGAQLGFPLAKLDQGYASGVESIEEAVVAWVRRFQEWGEVLAHQALSVLEPLPRTVSPRSDAGLTWLKSGTHQSWVSSSQRPITIVVDAPPDPLSERVMDPATLVRVTELANDASCSPPAAVALVVSARRAAQRGRLRLALMELGTALEAVLFSALSLPPEHRDTLGPLTQRAIAAGVPLPNDIQKSFVTPRNEAVHKNVSPARSPTALSCSISC